MPLRVRVLVTSVMLAAVGGALAARAVPSGHWVLFAACAFAVLLTSRMKVSLLRTDSSMSANFPFILLAVIELSPLQAMAVGAIATAAQCRVRQPYKYSLLQCGFNVCNAALATLLCWLAFAWLGGHRVEAAPALALGATVYFFSNSLLASAAIGWSQETSAVRFWREHMSWFLPFYLVGAALAAVAHFLSSRFGVGTALLVLPVAHLIYRAYNSQLARLRDREQHIAEMQSLHLRTIESLAMAIEAKDQETHDHLLRVRVYVTALGEALGLTHDELEAVKIAALLHDIGKLAVPEHIINKPGKLTPAEFEKMKIHPVVGADILERVRFPYPVVPIVRAHHEWWNGNGYPDGLAGEDIPIGARILTVVDCFDAMASDRPYRKAMTPGEAMAMVKRMAGTQFDPRVVVEMEARYGELEAKAREEGAKLVHQGLNTEVTVARGLAPGAGFADEGSSIGQRQSADTTPGSEDAHAGRTRGWELYAAVAAELARLRSIRRSEDGLAAVLPLLSSALGFWLASDCAVFYQAIGEQLLPFPADALASRCFRAELISGSAGVSGWVAGHHRASLNEKPTLEPAYQAAGPRELAAALALPVYRASGDLLGVLTFYSAVPASFSRDHLRALEACGGSLSALLEGAIQGPGSANAEPASKVGAWATPKISELFGALEEAFARGEAGLILLEDCATELGTLSAALEPDETLRAWGPHAVVVRPAAGLAERARPLRALVQGNPRLGMARSPLDGDAPEALVAVAERAMLNSPRGEVSPPPPPAKPAQEKPEASLLSIPGRVPGRPEPVEIPTALASGGAPAPSVPLGQTL